MLSAGAFNALLKTLEEPPEHVKFLFATTEGQKVPATIEPLPAFRLAQNSCASHCRTFARHRGKREDFLEPKAAEDIARGAGSSRRGEYAGSGRRILRTEDQRAGRQEGIRVYLTGGR